jgi:hypothetical protein
LEQVKILGSFDVRVGCTLICQQSTFRQPRVGRSERLGERPS